MNNQDNINNQINENKQDDTLTEVSANDSIALQEILSKAVTDENFKQKLINNPDEILNEYNVSEISRIMLKSLTEDDYNKLTPENIEEYFSADSAIYTPDFDDNIEVEFADESEI